MPHPNTHLVSQDESASTLISHLVRELLYQDYEKAVNLGCVTLVFASVFLGVLMIAVVRRPWSWLVHQLGQAHQKFDKSVLKAHDEVRTMRLRM